MHCEKFAIYLAQVNKIRSSVLLDENISEVARADILFVLDNLECIDYA